MAIKSIINQLKYYSEMNTRSSLFKTDKNVIITVLNAHETSGLFTAATVNTATTPIKTAAPETVSAVVEKVADTTKENMTSKSIKKTTSASNLVYKTYTPASVSKSAQKTTETSSNNEALTSYLKNSEIISNTLNNMLKTGGINYSNYLTSGMTTLQNAETASKNDQTSDNTNSLKTALSESTKKTSSSSNYSNWLSSSLKSASSSSKSSSFFSSSGTSSFFSQWIKSSQSLTGSSKGSLFDSFF